VGSSNNDLLSSFVGDFNAVFFAVINLHLDLPRVDRLEVLIVLYFRVNDMMVGLPLTDGLRLGPLVSA
jgi:hypothetical protein